MQTITIDIINEKAFKMIEDMELRKLIRVRKKKLQKEGEINWASKYKGAMYKQPLDEVDDQLHDLRGSWE